MRPTSLAAACLLALAAAATASAADPLVGPGEQIARQLPKPYATRSAQLNSKVIGWPQGRTPKAPAGFQVSAYSRDFDNPRWMVLLDNGDVLVSEAKTGKKSANRITLLRDADGDGVPELRSTFLAGLNQPFGMLQRGNQLYVANTDGVWVYPYENGQTKITAKGRKILSLPAGGYNNHWTRNIVASPDGQYLYVTVGSASNNGEYGLENEKRRANILRIRLDGSGETVFAAGLRNPNGIAFKNGRMWTAVNERDELGDNLVPDYITEVHQDGFYGWPYAYYGANEDPRLAGKAPELVEKTRVPDFAVGPHVAAMDITFYDGTAFPARYQGGALVGLHGSWNRAVLSGYKVLFVPFKGDKPSGQAEDFLSGFVVDGSTSEVYGRPVASLVLKDGSVLVSDDAGNTVWRVSHAPKATAAR
ncbi:PQQ-dependent sugar dehydrogenase [Stenotrophomonas sp. P5_B8]